MLTIKETYGLLLSHWKYKEYLDLVLKVLALLVPIGILSFIIFAILVRIGVFGAIPNNTTLQKIKNPVASEIYSQNDVLIGKYYLENRTNISYDLFPKKLIQALIATEDTRFRKHNGLDWRSYIRVILKTIILQDRSGGGGSTLTQQLAKNLFKRTDVPLVGIPVNKIREMFIARKLERIYSKNEILELYINTVPFGHNFYGLEVASRRYFGKSASRLKVEEAAVLVGMLKANTYYNPALHPERSKKRRNIVLYQMMKYGYLDENQKDSLQLLPLKTKFTFESQSTGKATYFRNMLRSKVSKLIKNKTKGNGDYYNLDLDGLKIYTTIDEGMQEYAESALKEHMKQLQSEFDKHWKGKKVWKKESNWLLAVKKTQRYRNLEKRGLNHDKIMAEMSLKRDMRVYTSSGIKKKNWSSLDSLAHYLAQLRSGFLALSPDNGAVLAWIGGVDYRYFQYDHVRSKRQIGSIFKPFLYYSAYKNGLEPCDYFQNNLATYVDYDDWTPRNSNGKYDGWYSLKGALANSVNTVSASLIFSNGIKQTVQDVKDFGWNEELPKLPSIALGTMNNSLENLLPLYCGLTNGERVPELHFVTKVTDRKGNILFEREEVTSKILVDKMASELVISNMQEVVNKGTASRLRWKYDVRSEVAGKTGTTQSGADGWFIACTPKIVAGAWVGGEYPFISFRSSNYGQGAHMALPIWAKFYRRLEKSKKYGWVNKQKFPALDSNSLALLNCQNYLDDSSYQEMKFKKELENINIDLRESNLAPILIDIIDAFKRNKDRRKPRLNNSSEIEKRNTKKKEKRERKKNRRDFLDRLFNKK